ncbi:MAG: hypothetical protein GY865_19855 [candidate division Zixibacteria bacterium]|nr:hypothetical protein [candidate division Zixibacteria bacterium]
MLFINKNIIAYDSRRPIIYEKQVGGKAKNLFYLYRRGFIVPPWLVIASDVYAKTTKPITGLIADILESIDFSRQTSIELASKKIYDLIIKQNIPQMFIDQINKSVEKKLAVGIKYSVRSSVVGEDSGNNSYAGQMDSFLNVSQNNIIDSIKKVWASAYSPRALTYRFQKGIDLFDVSIAVIIQEMIHAFSSGILFTRSPFSNAREINISAGYGLGEGIVQDQVETDNYQVKWNSDKITKQIGEKNIRVIPNSKDGTRMQLIEKSLQRKSVLSDSEVQLLCQNGIRAERKFGKPQDMEWAFNSDGELYILQSRPIVSQKPSQSQDRIWDNSNIVESYPGITLPLTFSFIQQGYEIAFKKTALGCLLIKREVRKELHIFKNMIGLLDGRVYYNLLNWYKMLSYLPGYKSHKKSWDQMIGINKIAEFPQTKLSWVNRLFSVFMVIFRLLMVQFTAFMFFRKFYLSYKKYKDIRFSSLYDSELIDLYRNIEREFSPIWHLTLYNDFCAMKYYDWLKKLCKCSEFDNYPNLHNDLLCGQPDIESVKPVHALLEMAGIIRGNLAYRELFNNSDYENIWINIITDTQYSPLKNRLSSYLNKYGDRGMEELKLEKPTYRDNPAELLKLIHEYSKTDLTASSMMHREKYIRNSAEKTVKENIHNRFKRVLFFFVLAQARRAIANRENMRFARSRLYGVIKKLFKKMSLLFCEQSIITKPDDLYYLTVQEIFSYIEGTSVNYDPKKIVQMRRAEYTAFKNSTPCERIHLSGIPYLSDYQYSQIDETELKVLKGIGCSSGVTKGMARVVIDPHVSVKNKEYILVAKSTDPGWVFLMIQAKGIIVEKGSVLSHTAIIGRELGIPTIVAVDRATSSIKNGDVIQIDGSTGVVKCA